MSFRSWRAWYADGEVRRGPRDAWRDGAVRVLVTLPTGDWLLVPGSALDGGRLSLDIDLAGPRVIEITHRDGVGFNDRGG